MATEIILSKMQTILGQPVSYALGAPGLDISLNGYIGSPVTIEYTGEIYCLACGKLTKKSFGQGYCYPCFIKVPETEECVLRPELCQAHLGIARDMEYAKQHCLIPHYVYLAASPEVKVGVTRETQIPTRWIDQGADVAVCIAKTENRYQAGCIEVALKKHIADKTNWRKMLSGVAGLESDLISIIPLVLPHFPAELKRFIIENRTIQKINYPVRAYPTKIVSVDLEKTAHVHGELKGIKGQYLMIGDSVMNVRKHGGYRVRIDLGGI